MKNNLLLIAILIAFTSSAQQRLSVKEAQELGLQNNIKVKNAKLEVSLDGKSVIIFFIFVIRFQAIQKTYS